MNPQAFETSIHESNATGMTMQDIVLSKYNTGGPKKNAPTLKHYISIMTSYLDPKVGNRIENGIYLHYVKAQIPKVSTLQKSRDQTKSHF